MAKISISDFLARLDSVRQIGPDRWMARCPAHDDHSPSLSIRESETGKLLLFCFAGCETESVLAALGLSWRDILEDNPGAHLDRLIRKTRAEIDHARLILRLYQSDIRAGRPVTEQDRETVRQAAETLLRART